MRPLPSHLRVIEGGGVCTDKPRRSKRRKRDAGERRSVRFELRLLPAELETWTRAAAAAGYLSVADWLRDGANTRARIAPLMSSDDETINTPQVVFDALAPLGPIALDPCSNASSIVPARVRFELPRADGLARSWLARDGRPRAGYVFCNPPYGAELERWAAKYAAEAAAGAEIVMLVPSRTDTGWWCQARAASSAVGYWRGRLKFRNGAGESMGTATFPSALLYAGPRAQEYCAALERDRDGAPYCTVERIAA